MGSKDGVIKDIATEAGFKYEPSFTYDGTRIVYGNKNGTYSVVSVPNALPGEPRVLTSGVSYTGSCRTWRDAAGNDYFIATDARTTTKIQIIPVDPGKGTQKTITMPMDAGSDGFCWVSLTADQTRAFYTNGMFIR